MLTGVCVDWGHFNFDSSAGTVREFKLEVVGRYTVDHFPHLNYDEALSSAL